MQTCFVSTQEAAEPYFPALARVIEECFNQGPWFEHWTEETASALLHAITSRQFDLVVALNDSGAAVGFGLGMPLGCYGGCDTIVAAGVDPDAYYILALATASEYREEGLCTTYCEQLLASARSAGYRSAAVRTRENNTRVFGIFARLGFEEVGTCEAETGGELSRRRVYRLCL